MNTTPRPLLKTIFLSPVEPRLRAGWRLLLQMLLTAVLILIPTIPLALLTLTGASIPLLAISQVSSVLAITLSVYLARRFLDRRSFASLGLRLDRRALWDVLAGIAFTGVMFAVLYAAMILFNWTHFTGFAWQRQSPQSLLAPMLLFGAIFILVGWQEELFSRGYQLQNLAEGFGSLPWGVATSSLIFALLHYNNPSFSWVALLGLILAGLALAYPYLRTRQLWLSIGIHIGWNYFEGPIFGFPVSGLGTPKLILQQVTGPDLFTGGGFGPEAGLILIPGILLLILLIHIYTRSRLLAHLPGA